MAKRKAMQSNTKNVLITVAVVVAAVAILGATSIIATVNQLSGTVTKVNGEKITTPYYNFFLYNMKTMYESSGEMTWDEVSADGQMSMTDMIKDSAYQSALSAKITEQQAVERGFELTPEELAEVDTVVASYNTDWGADVIKELGLNDDMIKEIITSQMLSQRVYDDVVKDVTVDPAAFETFFQDYLTQNGGLPMQFDADVIHTHTLEEATAVKAELDGGADFNTVWQANNISHAEIPPTDAGTVLSSDTTAQEIMDAAMTMLPGDISEPIAVPDSGFDIIRLNNVLEPDEAAVRAEQEEIFLAQQKDTKFQDEQDAWLEASGAVPNVQLIAAIKVGSLPAAPAALAAPAVPEFDPAAADAAAPVEDPAAVPVEIEPVPADDAAATN
jgi:parvulin-like peptidyl-prolyl isomerase